ncbi:MAG: winged helix-turn-helix transcriptional regulator [Pseudomonadales bacterium]|nr:winged helix-turn-helix transcriptional regulator [Pseudomonadales bacterium]
MKAINPRTPTYPQMERNFTVIFSDVYLRLRRYFNQQTREFGLTSTQWQVLRCLALNDGMTQTEIAEALDMGKSPLGKKIDALEESGWVTRHIDNHDRRAKRVYLTDKVDMYRDRLVEITEELIRTITTGLGRNEVSELIDSLIVMRGNLDRALDEGRETG